MARPDYQGVLIALVDLLKEQAREGAATAEGLNPYQALLEVKAQAEIMGVPLADIGLEGYDFQTGITQPAAAEH